MIRSLCLLGLALLAFGHSTLACQSSPAPGARLVVGSPDVQTSRIRARLDTLVVLLGGEGEERPAGLLTLRTRLAGEGADAEIVREEQMRTISGRVLDADSFAVQRRSLAPIHQRSWSSEQRQSLRFSDRRVQGGRTKQGVETPVDITTEASAFYGNSVDLVLASLPLRDGYAVQIPVIDLEHGVVTYLRARVTGSEPVETADGGLCQAWRVEVSGGNSQGTYWIERAERGLVRYQALSSKMRILRKSGCTSRLT